MKRSFDPNGELIIVPTEIVGPQRSGVLRFALDTGATRTLVSTPLLIGLGYDPALSTKRLHLTTGSGQEFVVCLDLIKLSALGRKIEQFPVIAHTLPPSATIDGLLGLDFFRDSRLVLDFKRGEIDFRTR
jgi:hypothetical protein